MNVVFDDSVGFYQARLTKKIECVTPTSLDPVEIKTKDEAEEESGHEEVEVNMDQRRVHMNHLSADVIGGVLECWFLSGKGD